MRFVMEMSWTETEKRVRSPISYFSELKSGFWSLHELVAISEPKNGKTKIICIWDHLSELIGAHQQ